jgi:hypothetical protein
LGAQSCLRLSLRTSISKKLHLGPQNGPGSENLLKIVNSQNGQKTVLSHLEKVGGPRYPLGSEVLCDFAPLDVCDVLLGQPYMWRHHVVYESQPHSVIVTLGGHLYIIPEVFPTIVPPKKCRKVVSHTTKFSFFTIYSKGE